MTGFLTDGEIERLTMQLIRAAGTTGMTESELDAAADEMDQLAASASFWLLWKQGRVTVKWDYGAGALRFVADQFSEVPE